MILRNKVILISGAENEIDMAVGNWLAGLGARVVVSSCALNGERNSAQCDEGMKDTRDTGAHCRLLGADWVNIESLANSSIAHIDVWMHNAGSVFLDRAPTREDAEGIYKKNRTTFMLVGLLLDLFKEGSICGLLSRASVYSEDSLSRAAAMSHLDFIDAYNLSRLENVLFSYERDGRLERAVAAHLFAKNSNVMEELFSFLTSHIPFLFVSPEHYPIGSGGSSAGRQCNFSRARLALHQKYSSGDRLPARAGLRHAGWPADDQLISAKREPTK
jgi:hypothetical protein